MTTGEVLTNIKNWDFTIGSYPLKDYEAEAIKDELQRGKKQVMIDMGYYCMCPSCRKDIPSTMNFCGNCGQRVTKKHRYLNENTMF